MKKIVLLRGVTPVGKNRIPKMSFLVECLLAADFQEVKTYRQSGNIVLTSDLADQEIAKQVHEVISDKIGADLAVIVKTKEQLQIALAENPFDSTYDINRVLAVFTNSQLSDEKVVKLKTTHFIGEEFAVGSQCFYLYLPRESPKKRLSNNYLEIQLGIVATSRKIKVIDYLVNM